MAVIAYVWAILQFVVGAQLEANTLPLSEYSHRSRVESHETEVEKHLCMERFIVNELSAIMLLHIVAPNHNFGWVFMELGAPNGVGNGATSDNRQPNKEQDENKFAWIEFMILFGFTW